ncbi:hypothetical protein D3C75_615720 [compost metagenome]
MNKIPRHCCAAFCAAAANLDEYDRLFELMMEFLELLPDRKPVGDHVRFRISGHPAHWIVGACSDHINGIQPFDSAFLAVIGVVD